MNLSVSPIINHRWQQCFVFILRSLLKLPPSSCNWWVGVGLVCGETFQRVILIFYQYSDIALLLCTYKVNVAILIDNMLILDYVNLIFRTVSWIFYKDIAENLNWINCNSLMYTANNLILIYPHTFYSIIYIHFIGFMDIFLAFIYQTTVDIFLSWGCSY